MKRIVALSCWALLLAGCAGSAINVVQKKEAGKPYLRVLAVYLDEPADLRFFDSTTYNICLKTTFLNTEKAEGRSRMEEVIVKQLSSSRTTILRSSDLFDSQINSYTDFRRILQERSIDGMFVVSVRARKVETINNGYAPVYTPVPMGKGTLPVTSGEAGKANLLNADFECYLMDAKNLGIPIWEAQLGAKSYSAYTRFRGLNRNMLRLTAKDLKTGGYIAR